MNKTLRLLLFSLLSGTLACRPLITIGWNELVILFVLVIVLLGPPVYKLVRRIESKMRKDKHD